MMTLHDAIKKYREWTTTPNTCIDGLTAALESLAKKTDSYNVCRLDDSEVFSEKYGQGREELFGTHRVAAVLNVSSYTYLLLSPKNRTTDSVRYIMYKSPGESEETLSSDDVVRQLTVENVDDYVRDLADIDALQRIDFRFYHKEYIDLESYLEKYPTLEEVVFSLRGGFHTSFKKSGIPYLKDTVRHKLADLKRGQDSYFAPFIDIDNISPIGCVRGPAFVYDLGKKSVTRPATDGEIIMALITSSRKQEGISNIGKSAIIGQGEEYYVNQSFAIISPRTGINPYFLQLSFGADYFLKQISRYRKPTSKFQDSVTLSDLKKVRIVTYDEEKMRALGDRHARRIRVYQYLLRTMILDRKKLEKQHERSFGADLLGTYGPNVREIDDRDIDDMLEKVFNQLTASKDAVIEDALSSDLKMMIKEKKRNVVIPAEQQ